LTVTTEANSNQDLAADIPRRQQGQIRTPFWLFFLKSGYGVESETAYRIWNLVLVVPLFIVTLPLTLTIPILLFMTQPRPVFYKGERLGKNRRTFHILKFRTLDEAQSVTKNSVLPKRSNLETPLGKYLRASRLDELPQLINILCGDMNLIGPRPVRADIAQELSATILDYDLRFKVKPGLFGYTQVVMPHATSKRLRGLFNAKLVRQPAYIWKEPFVLGFMIWVLMMNATSELAGLVHEALQRGARAERRNAPRKHLKQTTVSVHTKGFPFSVGRLRDINDESFTFFSTEDVAGRELTFVLRRAFEGRRRSRFALCWGTARPIKSAEHNGRSRGSREAGTLYMVNYLPVSNLHAYFIDKYFLENAIWSR